MNRDARFEKLAKLSLSDAVSSTILYARRYLRRYPDVGPAWLILGIALGETARYKEARSAFDEALRHYPENRVHRAWMELGHLSKRQGDLHSAAAWYRKVVAAKPNEADGYVFLGGTLARLGYLRSAELTHRRGTNCTEGCVDEAYLNLGLVLRAQGRFAEAIECCYEAIRLDPNYRHAKRVLSDLQRATRWSNKHRP